MLECSSSRGIKLLEHGMKVAERVLERKVETGSRDRQDAVWGLDQVQEQLMIYLLQDSYKRDIEENTGNCGGYL